MNDERLNRHITQENLALRSKVTQLQHQMGVKDDMINDMNEEILPILGEILQRLNAYADNVTKECGTLLMKAIHYAQAE